VYEVYLERAAQRDLRRLAPEEFQRVIAAIRTLADNAQTFSELIGETAIRIGLA
jgi:mRNA-degrading endonuclease RelE of RelBE toxin-antitoxin system